MNGTFLSPEKKKGTSKNSSDYFPSIQKHCQWWAVGAFVDRVSNILLSKLFGMVLVLGLRTWLAISTYE